MSDVTAAEAWPSGRVGYVALLGRPNTGKSTLLNTVLDYHLAAVSSQPQTTRRNCLGIHTDAGAQMLFLDVPGVHRSKHELDEAMARAIDRALADADVVLCIVDPTRPPGDEDGLVAAAAARAEGAVLIVLNKMDAASAEQMDVMRSFYRAHLPAAPVFMACATDRASLDPILDVARAELPEGPFLFEEDTMTDAYERQIGAELVREALLENLREEVPHAMAVTIEAWKDDPNCCRVNAVLHVEREQQKAIVIGRNGAMIKRLRSCAVKKLAEMCGKRVQLKLWVKVSRDWRRKKRALKDLGLLGG